MHRNILCFHSDSHKGGITLGQAAQPALEWPEATPALQLHATLAKQNAEHELHSPGCINPCSGFENETTQSS